MVFGEEALIRPVGHLLPCFGREKAKLLEIIAFSRAVRVGEGRRPDEGIFDARSIYSIHRLDISQFPGKPGHIAFCDER
jgi:hypothetical protein